MDREKRREHTRDLIREHWRPIFNYGFRMCLDRERATATTHETFLRCYLGADKAPAEKDTAKAWLLRICHHVLEKELPRSPEVSFDMLDDTLRSEATRTDVVRSLTNPQRDFMLWEMKQGCMTAVVNCLSPAERAAFVMSKVLGMSDDEAALASDVSKSAFKVRLSRAQKKVNDYLSPRCEHVEPNNPCRCPARVGIALKKGFIQRKSGDVDLRGQIPFGRYGAGENSEDAPLRDVGAIYKSLPLPSAAHGFPGSLEARLESGEWDRVLDQKEAERS